MTVMELVVATLILSIALAIGFGFLAQSSSFVARSEANSQAEKDAQLVLRTITQELRGLDPDTASRCASASTYDNCLQFTVYRNTDSLAPCPKSEFELRLTSAELLIDRRDFNSTGTSCPTPDATTAGKVLLRDVVNTSTEPLFIYYRSDGSRVDPVTAGDSLALVDSLQVTLKVKYRENAPILDFRSIVALRNNNVR